MRLNMASFGFIGTGNMGGALVKAACKVVPHDEIFLFNRTPEKARALASELGCSLALDAAAIAGSADFIFLGVKPQMMAELLDEIAPALQKRTSRFVLVTMAAGLSIDNVRAMAGGSYPVIRIMPNTPVSVGEGMILYTSSGVNASEEREFLTAMAGSGLFSKLPESLIDAGSAVSGCGPAYVDLFLEALADGAVACGLPRAQALQFAAQMTLGSARLALESGKHPAVLKDAVCSPGGTTIQGVRTLERAGFRSAVMDAVIAAYEKTKALGK